MKITLHTELPILPEYESLLEIVARFKGWSEDYKELLTPETVDENGEVVEATYKTFTIQEYLLEKVIQPAQMALLVDNIQPALNWYFGASQKQFVEQVKLAIAGAEITQSIE